MDKKKTALRIASLIVLLAVLCMTLAMLASCDGGSASTSGTSNTTTEPRKPLTYEEYNALSATEQEKYFNSFATMEEFFAWYNLAKQEFEDSQDRVEVGGDGDINIDVGE